MYSSSILVGSNRDGHVKPCCRQMIDLRPATQTLATVERSDFSLLFLARSKTPSCEGLPTASVRLSCSIRLHNSLAGAATIREGDLDMDWMHFPKLVQKDGTRAPSDASHFLILVRRKSEGCDETHPTTLR